MNDPRAPHEHHDPLLISAHAAGDTEGTDRDRATQLVAACAACVSLHEDLRALASAVHELPPAVRSRPFTLSARDAARLDSPWRRLAGAFAGDRFRLARPVGAGLASLGLAGLLISSLPGIPLGGAGAAAPNEAGRSESAAPSVLDSTEWGGVAPADDRAHSTEQDPEPLHIEPQAAEEGTGAPAAGSTDGDTATATAAETAADRSTSNTIAVLSGSFLILGLGLFGLRWTASRLGDG